MTLTPGLIEFDALLSTVAGQAPLALQLGRECVARLHLVRQPGRVVLACGGEHLTADDLASAVAGLLAICPPLLPVYARDPQGREFPLSMLPTEQHGLVLLHVTGQPLTGREIAALTELERDW